MIDERIAYGSSFVHKIDPRLRIVFAAIYAVFIALLTDFSAMLLACFISCMLAIAAKIGIRILLGRLSVVFLFLILIWITLPLTFKGEILYKAGPLTITKEGILTAAGISLKSIAIFTSFISLVATMTVAVLGQSLNNLKAPEKMVYLMLMTYRYVFVIEQEYKRLSTAAKLRGFSGGTNMHSYKTYAYIIGMLFVRASLRAEQVHNAMICRGFAGKFYSLHDFDIKKRDIIFVIFMMLVLAGLTGLQFL